MCAPGGYFRLIKSIQVISSEHLYLTYLEYSSSPPHGVVRAVISARHPAATAACAASVVAPFVWAHLSNTILSRFGFEATFPPGGLGGADDIGSPSYYGFKASSMSATPLP